MAKIIVGTNGADNIHSNGDESELWGLGGNDTYLIDYDDDFQHIVEAANAGTDTVILNYSYSGYGGPGKYSSTSVQYALADNVENLTADFYGSISAQFTGNALNNVITGGKFDDTIYGGTYGSAGGKDTLIGGDGDDWYYVDSSDDVIIEKTNIVSFNLPIPIPVPDTFDKAGEHDFVLSSAANYTLSANIEGIALLGEENINATGNASDNNMYGNDGNNTLSGLAGDDYLSGYYGNDKLLGGDGDDYLEGHTGNDTLDGGAGNDYLNGNGGSGYGATDNDSLIGGAGNDTLDSGDDGFADTLVGGAGDDVYYTDGLDVLNESAGAAGGIDTVIVTDDLDGAYTLAANIENATITDDSNIYSLTGNASANTLIGNMYGNTLSGLGGNDVLDGGEGDDTMAGGDGNDTYLVDDTGDIVIETNAAVAVGGKDTVYSDVSFLLGANVENLILTSTALGGSASIGQGNTLGNVITGNENLNTLIGNAGDDTLDGGAGSLLDILIGGTGNDTFIVNSGLDQIIEIAESGTGGTKDKIVLSKYFTDNQYLMQANVEQFDASAIDHGISLTGNNSANSIVGSAFNDTLDGRGGIDALVGGTGDDTYVIGSGDVVTEVANSGEDTVYVNGIFSYTLTTNVENGILLAGSGGLTGNTLNNFLKGNGAANSLSGGAGNDTLDGGGGADILSGGAGNDLYIVGAGDVITGETGGVDTVQTTRNTYSLADTVVGGAGVTAIDHLVFTGSGSFTGTGNALANSIVGGGGNDILNGGTGNAADTLDGGAGVDTMAGGGGNDTYFVDNGGDVVTELPNGGTDTVFSSANSYTLSAEVENLTLIGTANYAGGNSGKNTLTGNAENNSMFGGDGNDKIFGGDGNDGIDGGTGDDIMEGGKGDDTYTVDSTGDKVTETDTAVGYDRVLSSVNFTLGANLEGLYLTGTAVTGTGNALDNHIFGNASNNALSGLDGNDFIQGYDGNDTLKGGNGDDELYGDHDNDSLDGGDGNDSLDGGDGNDTMNGGAGDDVYIIDSDTDVVIDASGNDTAFYYYNGTYVLSAGIENAGFYGSGGTTVTVDGADNTSNNIIAGYYGNNISTGGGNDTISLGLEDGFGETIDGGTGIDTLNVTLGDYDGNVPGTYDFGFNNEAVTSALLNLENIVITSNGAEYDFYGPYGGSGSYGGGFSGSHTWNLGGAFDGTDAAHLNHIAINGGEYGGGALSLSGFGKNVDFTLQDYHRGSDYGGIDLNGVVGGWTGSDTLNITLDNFDGGLSVDDLAGYGGALNLTSSGGPEVENEIDLDDLYDVTDVNLLVTGDTSLSIAGLDSGATVAVNDFTGNLGVGIESDSGSDTLSLSINNSNTAINNSVFETIDLISSGNNFLDLSNNMSTNTNISGTDGLMAIKSNGGSISAGNFEGTLVVDASTSANAIAVIGGKGDDLIIGSTNNDNMWGSQGSDVLTGGSGNDIFNFSDMEDVDRITDFSSTDDSIHLDHNIFTGLGSGVALDVGNFFSATDVTDINLSAQAYILYDNSTGALYYDNDGTSTGDAVQFAQLGLNAPPGIDYSDFFIS